MFSVIIPLYNKSEFICRAIDSVLSQKCEEYEIIVINDGSTDGGNILVNEKYNSKLILIDQLNQGVSISRNRGIEFARYPYISFLDADDFWDPNYLNIVKKVIEKTRYPGIIGTDYLRFSSIEDIKNNIDKDILKQIKFEPINYTIKEFFARAIFQTLMFTSSVIIKKEFFESSKGFDPSIKLGEDLDVWFRAILKYEKITFIPSKLIYYSREDVSGATKKIYQLSNTLIPKIIKDDYFDWSMIRNEEDKKAFDRFKIKWIYLRLIPNYKLIENKKHIQTLIPQLNKKFFLIGWIYTIPFDILNKIFSIKLMSKYWKKYLYFCFKNIYK